MSDAQLARIPELIEPWFFFSFIWSLGSTTDNDGREKFSDYVREIMKTSNVRLRYLCRCKQKAKFVFGFEGRHTIPR